MTIPSRYFLTIAIAWALCQAGCTRAPATVHGQVSLPDGRPAAGVIVTFEETEQHLGASGTADADGHYRLGTTAPGDGTPPGKYVVSVHQPGPADSSQPQPARTFPLRYERPATSGLTCEVQPGDNTYDIPLKAE
jgi:hypothetical protein